jgi:alkanesulfonate monooxygenase SsuD/methylene tetrahydromethanopterin reductase-like flavin-dependent oxidoreductase (luciferase family)
VPLLLLRLDMRRPDFATAPREKMYAEALEMASWADEHGFLAAVLSEHHGVDDGYLPSPLILGAAILGRTKRLMLNVSALLAPLYQPLRLAEDIAVLDNIAPGRIALIAGLGYRDHEYAMFGVEKKKRGAVFDEALQTLLTAWTGEEFEFRGERVRVTPKPASQPHPMIFVGGSSEAGARRAGRFGLPFQPAYGDPALEAAYNDELAKHGKQGFIVMPESISYVHVAEDVDAAWEQVGPHMLYDAQTYASWQNPGQQSAVKDEAQTVDELRKGGIYRVLTPDETVAFAEELGPMRALILHPMVGGLDPAIGWESLRLFAEKVQPHLAK